MLCIMPFWRYLTQYSINTLIHSRYQSAFFANILCINKTLIVRSHVWLKNRNLLLTYSLQKCKNILVQYVLLKKKCSWVLLREYKTPCITKINLWQKTTWFSAAFIYFIFLIFHINRTTKRDIFSNTLCILKPHLLFLVYTVPKV